VHAAVLDATVELLLARGLDDVSISAVAARAGVHETSIYRRWGTKANLVLAALLDRLDAQVPEPDTGSLRGDLVALLHAIANFVRSPLGQALLRIALRQDQPEYAASREWFWTERFAVAWSAVLGRAEARGEVRRGIDRRLSCETALGALSLRVLLTHEPIDDDVVEAVVDLVVMGIGTAHPA
jgi:AcrR family transcriptional regulator